MWKNYGFIAHRGHYPESAEYLVYNDFKGEVTWTSESNDAFISQTRHFIKWLCAEFGIKDYSIRMVVLTDTEFK